MTPSSKGRHFIVSLQTRNNALPISIFGTTKFSKCKFLNHERSKVVIVSEIKAYRLARRSGRHAQSVAGMGRRKSVVLKKCKSAARGAERTVVYRERVPVVGLWFGVYFLADSPLFFR
jgi:hypothetical protein